MFEVPLRFTPLYQTRIWGGRRLETLLGRTLPESALPCGESWEISDRVQEQSVTGQGISLHELWTHHRAQVFGEAYLNHPAERFPLLMKILDACDDLSIQVHPPASVAAELGGEPKTEMWLVAHAEPGARIYVGLRAGVTRAIFEKAIASGTVAECVHVIEPRAGDCLFIPSGRIHAIGAGLLIYEIQQNSDTTYRVFDWNRTGLDGTPRALHVAESLQSIDFTDFAPALQLPKADGTLVECLHFQVRLGRSGQGKLGVKGEHLTLAVVHGALSVGSIDFRAGDFAIIPACMSEESRHITASAGASWLEVRF